MSNINYSLVFLLRDYLVKMHNYNKVWFIRRAVYLYLVFYMLQLYSVSNIIWGTDSVMLPVTSDGTSIYDAFSILTNTVYEPLFLWFYAGNLLFLITGLLGIMPRISSLLVFYFTANLFVKSTGINTAGNYLIQQLLFFLMFTSERKENAQNPNFIIQFDRIMTNAALMAMKIQLCVLYFFSALYKLTGKLWINGEAFYYSVNIDEYSLPVISDYLNYFVIVLYAANYLSLLYQVLFPFMIWNEKWKNKILITGILFHLLTAFIMGLPDFALAMIVSYSVFSERVLSKFVRDKYLAIRGSLFGFIGKNKIRYKYH
jgi:hypothetical protein